MGVSRFRRFHLGRLRRYGRFPASTRRQAAAWCEYLESHAQRVYSCVVTPQLRAARELAEKIKKRKAGR